MKEPTAVVLIVVCSKAAFVGGAATSYLLMERRFAR